MMNDGKNVVPDVWEVLDKIKAFSDKVRSGEWTGITGKTLKNIVAIGIGGSFLGPLFVHTALRYVLMVDVLLLLHTYRSCMLKCFRHTRQGWLKSYQSTAC